MQILENMVPMWLAVIFLWTVLVYTGDPYPFSLLLTPGPHQALGFRGSKKDVSP